MSKVIAVVVTYNRKELLQECLDAILAQSFPVEKIVLIDNASTDGTGETLKEKGYLQNPVIDYRLMHENLGGSGGFYEGIKIAREVDCDWIWVMDDDTIPTKECLEKLMAKDKELSNLKKSKHVDRDAVSFYASAIYGEDAEFMNVPELSERASDNGYPYWYQNLAQGVVYLRSATFVSILIKREATERCGLPCRDYFIWGDDTEYTTRLTTFFGEGVFVGESVAIHKRKNAKILSIKNETETGRIQMFRYFYRNRAINAIYYDKKKPFVVLVRGIGGSILDIKRLGAKKAKVRLKGTWQAVRTYKKFKNYIDGQVGKKHE